MKPPRAPELDARRTPEFSAELQERARAWIPEWGLGDGARDFGGALLEVAARFSSEIAERLDGAGEKMRRGFLDWLAVPRVAARPARMPVVFKLADTATEAVLASAPVRLQADAGGTSVIFETESDVRVVPGRLDVVIGVDAANDAYFLPPPGLSELKPLESLPAQWQLKAFASARSTKLQLDPELGLVADMILEVAGQQYRIVQVDKDLVTIEPPLVSDLAGSTVVTKVTLFSPFDGKALKQQEHALYLGDADLLNVEAEAAIDVVGAAGLITGVTWQYWGKAGDKNEVDWQPLPPDGDRQKKTSDAVALKKPKGAMEQNVIAGQSSRWIRGISGPQPHSDQTFSVERLQLRINSEKDVPGSQTAKPPVGPTPEAMTNSTPLVLSEPFYPLGREPRQFDAFYLGCSEAFSKKGSCGRSLS